MEKFFSLIIVWKTYSGPFLKNKVVKKGYCRNVSLGLAWDRMKMF